MKSLERATLNELRFREFNEKIDERRAELGLEERIPYLCECEDATAASSCGCRPRSTGEHGSTSAISSSRRSIRFGPAGSSIAATGYMVVQKGEEAAAGIDREERGDG